MEKIFNSGRELATLFTEKNHCDFDIELNGEPIEVWQQDILNNLTKWVCEGDTIRYQVANGVYYIFEIDHDNAIITMMKCATDVYGRQDSWMNTNSCTVGKSFLMTQLDKEARRMTLIEHIDSINEKAQAEMDANPKTFIGILTNDPNHWAEYGVYTPEQFEKYLLDEAEHQIRKAQRNGEW